MRPPVVRTPWLALLIVSMIASGCLKARARRPDGLPPATAPTPPPTTETHNSVPGFTFASGGTYLTTGGEYLLHSTIRQVGRPIVQTSSEYVLLPGQQGSHFIPTN